MIGGFYAILKTPMDETNIGAEFLQKKYHLHTSKEVKHAAKRAGKEPVGKTDEENTTLIQNYLDRLHTVIHPPSLKGHPSFERKMRNLTLLKQDLYRHFVTTPEDIPESYYDGIKRRHREEGHGDITIPDDYRRELAEGIIEDQQRSLDVWVDYLTSDDAKYPDWLKYYAFRSILRMGNFDKQKRVFNERTKGKQTIAPFPELNREALAIVLSDVERYEYDHQTSLLEFSKRFDITNQSKMQYRQFLTDKNFSKLYALAIAEFKPIVEELLQRTEGQWVKYPKGSDPRKLVDSIAEYGTGWCLRGEAVARRYLISDQNDLYIYYSHDTEGKAIVPRVVMVINNQGAITEVRGVARGENLDPYIGEVVEAKLTEPAFKEKGAAYKKKSADMKRLTTVDHKVKARQPLDKEDLIFLYEINAPIEGFGYEHERDPRIDELRKHRNKEDDMLVIFACTKEQITHTPDEITAHTKAYVGKLEPGVFDRIREHNIKHVYTSFPDGKIDIGFPESPTELPEKGFTPFEVSPLPYEEFERKRQRYNRTVQDQSLMMRISDVSRLIMNQPAYQTLTHEEKRKLILVRLNVRDLGYTKNPTTRDIIGTAEDVDEHGKSAPFTSGIITKLGLELCPPEVGPQLRLSYMHQPLDEWLYIGMKPITDSHGGLSIFAVARRGGGLWLSSGWVDPDDGWGPEDDVFLFSLRTPADQASK